MTATTIRVQMAQRKDTAANWTAANPILLSGEIGFETDTKKFKIGDGTTNWNSLAYLPIPDGSGNLTITGNLEIGTTGSLTFEGSTADGFETTLAVTNPTADRTITLPDRSGTVITSGDTGTVTSTMLADGTIVNADISATAEIAVSKLANGTANQIITTDGTDVSWSSNLNLAGNATIQGDLTVNGTTTTIDTQTLLVEDKNIEMGVVATPTDVTADGGGITLKGTTDKTINWVDATDAWTSSERFSVPLGSAAAPTLTFTGDPNTGIYSPGADQVAISTGGAGRLFVSQNRTGVNINPTAFQLQVNENSGAASYVHITNSDTGTTGSDGALIGLDSDEHLIVWNQEAKDLRLATSGQERLRITSAGLVGVGVSAPGAQIDVYNSQASGVSEIARLRWNNAGTGGALTYANQSGTVLGQIANVNSGSGAELAFSTYSNSSALGERMRLTSTGLAIGTTSPVDAVHVLSSGGNTRIDTSTNAGTASLLFDVPASNGLRASGHRARISCQHEGVGWDSSLVFYAGNTSTTPSEAMRIDASRRLLVGTSSARSNYFNQAGIVPAFQVVGNTHSASSAVLQNTAANLAGAYFHFGKSRGTGYEIVSNNDYLGIISFQGADGSTMFESASISAQVDGTPGANDMPGRLVFSVTSDGASSPTERMRISNNGYSKHANAGSGAYDNTTGAYHELVSDGADNAVRIKNTNATPFGLRITHTTDSNAAGNEFLACFGAATIRAAIRSNGGLANYSANDANLSDRNAKKDISPAADTWDCIKEWEIVNYRYKDQSADADLNLGVIAQQVAESCPEVITVFSEAKDDQPEKLGVKEQQMYWMAIKALQEAQVRIEALEAEVTALKAQ